MHLREVQSVAFFQWEWPREDATTPSTCTVTFENGDPYWDTARFGLPAYLDVYDVLLLEQHQDEDEDEDEAWYTRVGVGKINMHTFRHADPKDTMVTLR
jgi:hypothetical protein